MTTRSRLYALLRTSNDVNAVASGRVGSRIVWRALGRTVGQLMRSVLR